MKYIDSFYLNGFRGFKDFKLSNLKEINVIVGDNNTGKTSLLEAIHVLEYPGEIGHYIKVCRKREGLNKISPYSIFINSISKDDAMVKKISIEGNIKKKNVGCFIEGEILKVIKSDTENEEIEAFEGILAYKKDNGEFNQVKNKLYIDEETDRVKISNRNSFSPVNMIRVMPFDHIDKEIISTVIKSGRKQEIIEVLKIFDPDITGFETIKEDCNVKIYIQHKKTGLLPLSAYGDGLKKVFYLSSVIINAKGGVLLIDEVETAIHYSALEGVFKWFIKASNKYEVQIFFTTHSLEALDVLLECSMNYKGKKYLEDSINIITLRKGDTYFDTKVRILNGYKAFQVREDFNMELRG
ncbi:ATP/GTP phosphatase [Clostridium tepidiprofundi DSM 19306]|uniref:ATP/GTP phosphatase n=1 Tax=Clostridium tepidiprofundi DSM 19306 TaxID=1121338 RepID=A0A151B3B8_9CLOT|nr:ATP-binding protein [Clostridium tepidiprofundi]KYH34429.1 ATP/GTP phosphatase [Clostridium tepidiprofundi DSM 19306]